MTEPQTNPAEVFARVGQVAKELRKSDAYPAIVGGIAGGIAGALMAAIIASRVAPRNPAETKADTAPRASKDGHPGFSIQDLAQLATVVISLARQVQTFVKEHKKG
ncbi:MAG: hypothetical protein HY868_14745 [Chloroflexi bacterium]|nr:hypothetical protein [Chloroflexota bacterium]